MKGRLFVVEFSISVVIGFDGRHVTEKYPTFLFYYSTFGKSVVRLLSLDRAHSSQQTEFHLYYPPEGGDHHVLFDVRTVISDVRFRHDAARRSKATTSFDNKGVCHQGKNFEPRTTKRGGEQRVVVINNVIVRKRRRKKIGLE